VRPQRNKARFDALQWGVLSRGVLNLLQRLAPVEVVAERTEEPWLLSPNDASQHLISAVDYHTQISLKPQKNPDCCSIILTIC
jgi:hypothetical protein